MSWPPVLISAPGKVILHGEHAVVYGKVALATSLDLRCFLLMLPRNDGSIVLELRDIQLQRTWTIEELWARCLTQTGEVSMDGLKQLAGVRSDKETPSVQSLATLAFLYLLMHIYQDKLRSFPGLYVSVASHLPASAGLGSSAAYSVCLAAGLLTTVEFIGVSKETVGHIVAGATTALYYCSASLDSGATASERSGREGEGGERGGGGGGGGGGVSSSDIPEAFSVKLRECGYGDIVPDCGHELATQQLEAVNKWGFKAEELIHGTPSGIDNSVSTFGGAIRFQSGSVTHLKRMPAIRILLVNTNVPRSTKKMVAGVREKRDKYPQVIGPLLDSVEAISVRAQDELEKLAGLEGGSEGEVESHKVLQELCVVNQHLLNAIGVGHPSLDRVCGIAQRIGLSAKLTGGGGGGCSIALIPPGFSEARLAEAKAAFSEAGFDCWETLIGSRGVSKHINM